MYLLHKKILFGEYIKIADRILEYQNITPCLQIRGLKLRQAPYTHHLCYPIFEWSRYIKV